MSSLIDIKYHKKYRAVFILTVLALFTLFNSFVFSDIYFKNTDFELEVIRLKGEKPGPTLLIFGGIHGDEEGGYSAAEVLSKIKISNGKLIIVPRVNFPGIMQYKREIYGDMNRKFTKKEYPNDPDHKLIVILKKLIAEADIFINQHDAFGFHRNKYISKGYNPFRYGQCLIVDTGSIFSKKFNKKLNINAIGKRIIESVNKEIKNPKHRFAFWNQKSIDINTSFKDMQKSATYFAVTRFSIPAFGLETSKNLPNSALKIKYQLLVITKLMDEFGFKYTLPTNIFTKPVLYWIEFIKTSKTNTQSIIRVNSSTNIRMEEGEKIRVSKIKANYKVGLSFDILDWQDKNDFNNEYTFTKERTAFIRKNQKFIGKVRFKKYNKNSIRKIIIKINNSELSISNWGLIKLKKTDKFEILYCDNKNKKYRFDIRGFNKIKNKKDDSRTLISYKNLIKKHSFKKEGEIYFVKIYDNKSIIGGFQIEFNM